MPWKLMSSSHNYIQWLVDYSAVLGPVAGIMVADYFFLRHTRLDTESLYRREGQYEYRNGINPRALIALAAGVVAALIGIWVPAFEWLFKLAWFVGFGVAAFVYLMLMGSAPSVGGATPLAQRIKVNALDKVLDPAMGTGAGAKARSIAARRLQS
jgi:NCS1 family nucleobase:cation symporter-1